MYEIIVRIGEQEFVYGHADAIVSASNLTSYYRQKGYQAHYRPVLKRVA